MRGPDRRLAAVGITLAGIVLTVASCTSHPIATPAPTATVPQLRHLASAIVLEAMLSQSGHRRRVPGRFRCGPQPGGGPGQCYRQLGKPVTITSAAVSLYHGTAGYGLLITVPAA